jgi:hypothetical protein
MKIYNGVSVLQNNMINHTRFTLALLNANGMSDKMESITWYNVAERHCYKFKFENADCISQTAEM